ncbi:MAG: hypothetical protein AAF514_20930, partial [Verrucomicrobiota bacterium]
MIHRTFLTPLASLTICLLFLPTKPTQAEDFLINDFKDKGSLLGTWDWWGDTSKTLTWESDDAGDDQNSGSLKMVFGFDRKLDDNQYAVGLSLDGDSPRNTAFVASAKTYTKLAFDIRWNPESTISLDDFNASE